MQKYSSPESQTWAFFQVAFFSHSGLLQGSCNVPAVSYIWNGSSFSAFCNLDIWWTCRSVTFRGCLGLAFMWPGNQTRPLEWKPELLQLQRPGHVEDGALKGHRPKRIPFPQITSWSGKRPVLLPSYVCLPTFPSAASTTLPWEGLSGHFCLPLPLISSISQCTEEHEYSPSCTSSEEFSIVWLVPRS